MARRIYAAGESLTRIDVEVSGAARLFPTGTALNLLAGIARLKEHSCHLATALSSQKDAGMFKDFARKNGIDLETSFVSEAPIGSYALFKTPALYGWEVVYNRKHTCWTSLGDSHQLKKLAETVPGGSHFHFDGISLCSSEKNAEDILWLLGALRQKGVSISFDFNFRSHFGDYAAFEKKYRQAISLSDFVNISEHDLSKHFKAAKKGEELSARFLKTFPNVEVVCGTARRHEQFAVAMSGFITTKTKTERYASEPYRPVDLLGVGDAFFAHFLSEKLSLGSFDVKKSVEFAVLKSLYAGDANGPDREEYAAWIERKPVKR